MQRNWLAAGPVARVDAEMLSCEFATTCAVRLNKGHDGRTVDTIGTKFLVAGLVHMHARMPGRILPDTYLPEMWVRASKKRIEIVLNRIGISDLSAYRPTPDREELDQKVAELRSRPLGKTLAGNVRPPCISTASNTYVRDPAVKRWVLELAHGVCEGCCEPAPFHSIDGYPYLEVHHVMPLALLGSD